MKVRVTLDTKTLDRITAEANKEAAVIVKAGAFAVEGQAKTRAPVDTGALKSSLEAEENGSPLRWWVHDGVEYGIFQELGTSKMGAQPFLVPAVEAVRDNWTDLWRKFFERWK
jgi:HK97 gp10 family phage protein